MADIKFACPHCNQHITCDELWGGHELQCPGCKGKFVVPAVAGPAPAVGNPLVPTPPRTGVSKVGLNRPQAHGAEAGSGASAPNKGIPIRNLAPPVEKRQSPVVKLAIGAAVVVALGAGGYFGFIWVSDFQAKAKAKSAEADQSSLSGQVGHIAELKTVMNATDPAASPSAASAPPTNRRKRPADGAPVAAQSDAGAANPSAGSAAADSQPSTPPVWAHDLAFAKIPETRANGSISGTNFLVETARFDPVGTAQVLRLQQGPAVSPDREVLVYLHLKPGEKLGGQTLAISQDMRGIGVPQVSKRWKTDPKYAATIRSFSTGYVMKLELGQLADNAISGKIYLAFPDTEQSVVGGTFKATVVAADPNLQAMPVAAPTAPTAQQPGQSAMDQRYGIRR